MHIIKDVVYNNMLLMALGNGVVHLRVSNRRMGSYTGSYQNAQTQQHRSPSYENAPALSNIYSQGPSCSSCEFGGTGISEF